MSKYGKLLQQVLRGTSDANIAFDDLCQLLVRAGFEMHINGSHYIFSRGDVDTLINLQREGSKAKSYQVRQVRRIVVRHQIGDDL